MLARLIARFPLLTGKTCRHLSIFNKKKVLPQPTPFRHTAPSAGARLDAAPLSTSKPSRTGRKRASAPRRPNL
jgi:hypothetical protein